jgi:hypothetical protein
MAEGWSLYTRWKATAPVRRAARVRAEYTEIYLLAERRVKGSSPGFVPTLESAVGLPEQVSEMLPYNCHFELQRLENTRVRSRSDTDNLAGMLADALMSHVYRAIKGDPGMGKGRVALGHSGLAGMVRQYNSSFQPTPPHAERLRMAVIMMSEGLSRGIRFYAQDDDLGWEDVTPYFRAFHTMASSGLP